MLNTARTAKVHNSGEEINDFPMSDPSEHFVTLEDPWIIDELKQEKIWIVWQYQPQAGKKPNKRPVDPTTGGFSPYNNTSIHRKFDDTYNALQTLKEKNPKILYGLGIYIQPQGEYSALDFDNCFDESGVLDPEVLKMVKQVASYTEISPSRKGIRIIIKGKVEKNTKLDSGKSYGIEVYGSDTENNSWVTITGNIFEQYSTIQDATKEVNAILKTFKKPKERSSRGVITLTTKLTDGRNRDLSEKMFLWFIDNATSKDDFTEEHYQNGLEYALQYGEQHHKPPYPRGELDRPEMLQKWFQQAKDKFDESKKGNLSFLIDRGNILECMTEVFLVDEIVFPELQGQVKYLEDTKEWAVFDTSDQGGYPKNQWIIDAPSKVKNRVKATLKDSPLARLRNDYPQVFEPLTRDEKALRFKSTVERWGYSYQQNKNIAQVMSLFQCDQRINARYSEFDTRKVGHYFPVDNGLIDLKTGKLVNYSPEMKITRRAGIYDEYDGIKYTPTATCPKWLEFINQITCENIELAKFLQRLFGYVMSAGNPERKLFTAYGEGKNGKSTILNVVSRILGKASDGGFFRSIPITALTQKQYESNGEELTHAVKARLAVASESNKARSLDEGMIKNLTGNEEITYRKMHVGTLTVTPDFTIIICTNHPLKISGTDQAMIDRVMQIPFNYRVPEGGENKNLLNELLEEREGILAWMVRGAVDYAKDGLGTCEAVEAATKAYIRENNSVAMFADDCVRKLPEGAIGSVQVKTMYEHYTSYCIEQKFTALSRPSFGKELKKLGHESRTSTGNKTQWIGVELLKENDFQEGEDMQNDPRF